MRADNSWLVIHNLISCSFLCVCLYQTNFVCLPDRASLAISSSKTSFPFLCQCKSISLHSSQLPSPTDNLLACHGGDGAFLSEPFPGSPFGPLAPPANAECQHPQAVRGRGQTEEPISCCQANTHTRAHRHKRSDQ